MHVSYIPEDICWREYEPFSVLYDLKSRQILTLENVAADIWHDIASNGECNVDEIANTIAAECGCAFDDVFEDVSLFINELYESGIVLVNGKRKELDKQEKIDGISMEDIEGDVIRSLEPYNQLYSATIELTYACNENCVHCYAHFPGAKQDEKPIPLQTYRRLIDELHTMGCMHLALTGGDPFMHRDFPEVFFYARSRGFVCDVYTNGLFLYSNEKLLDRMASAQPRAFFVSLYGSNPEVHDAITRIPGSFEKTTHVIKALRSRGVPVVLNVMLLSINHHDLPGIIELADSLDASYRASVSLIRRNDGSDKPMDYFIGEKDAIKRVLSTVEDSFYSVDVSAPSGFKQTEHMCGAGVTSISIDPSGLIHPCLSLKNALGNIAFDSIQQAWDSEERQAVMSMLRWDNTKECLDCRSRDFCPHCPGMSQAESGDVFACNTCDKIVSECIMEVDF